jgi:hypothetical protein
MKNSPPFVFSIRELTLPLAGRRYLLKSTVTSQCEMFFIQTYLGYETRILKMFGFGKNRSIFSGLIFWKWCP